MNNYSLLFWLALFGFFGVHTGYSEEFNIAPYSKVRSIPYGGFSLVRLTDGMFKEGEVGEGIHPEPQFCTRGNADMRLGAEIIFDFSDFHTVRKIRLFRTKPEIRHKLYIDRTGSGEYGEPEAELTGETDGWLEYVFNKSARCRGLKLKAYGGAAPVYLGLEEVEIIVEGRKPSCEISFSPLREIGRNQIGNVELKEDNIRRTLYVLGPMIYGAPDEWAEKIKELGVNSIILYGHSYGNIKALEEGVYTLPEDPELKWYLDRGMRMLKEAGKSSFHIAAWPSRMVPGTKENYLKKTIEAMHRQNIKVVVSVGFFIPFDPTGKHYPRSGQNDWHLFPGTPCIISDDFVAKLGSAIYKEVMENGADGVVLGGDESTAEGHRLSAMSLYDPCVKKFTKKYGYENLPVDAEDTLRYRRWEIFEYEGIANLFGEWTKTIKRIKKDAIAVPLFSPAPVCYSDRMWSGIAFDIMGHNSGMDHLTTDYYRPMTTMKRLVAASPSRKGGYTWTAGYFVPEYLPFKRAVDLYGPLLAILGQSGRQAASLEIFERRHIIAGRGGKPSEDDTERNRGYGIVRDMFNMMKYLQREGIDRAEPPRKIALLYSRSSDDWWQLKHNYKQSFSPTIMRNTLGPEWHRILSERITAERTEENFQQMDGYIWHQAVMDLLTSRAYPFDMYYIDQDRTLGDLSGYEVLVLPFGYSVSAKAAAAIKKAVVKGTPLIMINFTGETDEWGEPYKNPIFKDITGKENVFLLNLEIRGKGEDDLAEAILPIIDRYSKGIAPAFRIMNRENLYGRIFCFTVEEKGRYFVTIVNFSNTEGKVEIDFPFSIRKIKGVTPEETIDFEPPKDNVFDVAIQGASGMVLICDR